MPYTVGLSFAETGVRGTVIKAPDDRGIGSAAVTHPTYGTLFFKADQMHSLALPHLKFNTALLGKEVDYDLRMGVPRSQLVARVRPRNYPLGPEDDITLGEEIVNSDIPGVVRVAPDDYGRGDAIVRNSRYGDLRFGS